VAYINLSKAYQAKGDYRNAVVYAKEAEHLSDQYDMKDAKLETYSMLAECYEQLNMNEQTEAYRNRYFRIKDTLLNYHQLASVNEMQFLDKMKAIDDQMTAIKHRSQIKSIIATVALLFALVIVVFFIVVFRKNKKLRATNESLYKKNVEMLKRKKRNDRSDARRSDSWRR
jgi:tetratricopeptide (TPR) repeat protein